jgi:hypothetical protein
MLFYIIPLRIPRDLFPLSSPTNVINAFLVRPTRATCLTHLIFLYVMMLTKLGVQYNLLCDLCPLFLPLSWFQIAPVSSQMTPSVLQCKAASRYIEVQQESPTRHKGLTSLRLRTAVCRQKGGLQVKFLGTRPHCYCKLSVYLTMTYRLHTLLTSE